MNNRNTTTVLIKRSTDNRIYYTVIRKKMMEREMLGEVGPASLGGWWPWGW